MLDNTEMDDPRISDIIPLVVNTMGWTKGLGADLSRKIEEIVEPTNIFEIEAPIFESGWNQPPPPPPSTMYAWGGDAATLHLLQPIASAIQSTTFSPAEHRSLSILSYFHALFPARVATREFAQTTALEWDTETPLCAMEPYEVNLAEAVDKIVLAGAGMEDVVPEEIQRVLNGAIVGLVSCEPGTLDVDEQGRRYIQGELVPSPATSQCYKIALVRGVSATVVQLLTPLAEDGDGCRVLVKGEMELPIWGMLDHRLSQQQQEEEETPFLQWGKGEGLGGEKRRVRRNLMRKGQM